MSYKKPTIFIDANALSHISSLELNKRKVGIWLWHYFDVKTCTAVKNEYLKRVNSRDADSRALSRKLKKDSKLVPLTRSLSRLENDWLATKYYTKTLTKSDEGERHLICVALEFVCKKNASQAFVVTDDLTARNYFLDKLKADIPFGEIWSTIDLVLYMYFAFSEVSYEFTEASIRDISSLDSFGFKAFKTRGDTETDARMRMLKAYIAKLNNLKFFKQKIA